MDSQYFGKNEFTTSLSNSLKHPYSPFLSQNCILFSANRLFQVFDKIRHCKYLIYKFSNFNRKYSVISILSLLSLLVSGPRVLKIDLLFVKVVYLSTCIEPVWWCITLVSHKSVGQPCQVVPVVVP